MAPTEDANQTLNTNTPEPYPEAEPQPKSWWPLWLLGGLILLFLIMIIILRGLCTDVWYINMLGLNDKLCSGTSSLEQDVSLEDGSITGPEIAEGAISLDQLSPSLQATINNINNQLANPVPGPQGPSGFNGIKGNTGATGATGPAGPTDPCVINGTYFCQGGNSFGTLAVLGTNDANELNVITDGKSNTVFDVNGNLVVNRTEEVMGFRPTVDVMTNSNVFINQDQTFDSIITSTGSGIFGGTNSNFLTVSDSILSDVGGSTGLIANSTVTGALLNGSVVEATISGLVCLTGGFWGGSATDSFALNGLFLNTEVTSSSYIMGNFQEGFCIPIFGPCPPPVANIITSSNNILGMTDSTSILGSDRLLVSGRDSSITSSNDSLLSVTSGSITDADRSLVFLDTSTASSISQSHVNLAFGSTILSATNSTISGAGLVLGDIGSSYLSGGFSSVDSLTAWHGNVAFSDIGEIFVGNGAIAYSTIADVAGLYGTVTESSFLGSNSEIWGEYFRADVTDSKRLMGMFGERNCGLPAPTCPVIGPNSVITDSFEIMGLADKTNIISSNGLLLYTDSSDPTTFMTTISDSTATSVTGVDLSVTGASYSTIVGDSNTIDIADRSLVVGDLLTVTPGLGFGVGAYYSSITGYESTVSDLVLSSMSITGSTLDGGIGINGGISGSTVTALWGMTGSISASTVSDSTALNGNFQSVDIASSNNLMGLFGRTPCFALPPLPPCPPIANNTITDSDQLMGSALYTDISDSIGVLLNTNSSDPTTFVSTIGTTYNSLINSVDIAVSETDYSQIHGTTLAVTGLDHSVLIGDSLILDATADPTYDYSFIGADSAGTINTRINYKGDDSWLNATGGGVGIGTTTPAGTLDVDGTMFLRTATASTAGDEAVCRDPGTNEVTIAVGATDCTLSSERFKHNIEELGLGLDFINGLRAVSYNRNSDGLAEVGFIAEEVAKLDSRLVFFEQDGETVRGVKYNQLTAILTNAIQEQDGKLEGINTQLAEQGLRVDNLAGELKALAERVEKLEQDFASYKQQTEARLRELERRTGGSLDSLPVEPGAQPEPAN